MSAVRNLRPNDEINNGTTGGATITVASKASGSAANNVTLFVAPATQTALPQAASEQLPERPPASAATQNQNPSPSKCYSRSLQAILLIISFSASVPMAINSLTFPNQPSVISADWWYALSIGDKIFAAVNALSSMTSNILTNVKYIPYACLKLYMLANTFCTSISHFFGNTGMIFLGLAAALVAAGIAFTSLVALNLSFATISAIFNFIVYGARRITGVIDLVDKIKDSFDDEVKNQKTFVQKLHYLKPTYREDLLLRFQNKPLNEQNSYDFLLAAADMIETSRTSLFRDKTICDSTIEVLATAFDIIIASVCALWAFIPVGLQAGFDGLNLLTNNSLSGVGNGGKLALGLIPGLATGAFYFVSAYNVRDSFIDIYDSMKRSPLNIPKGIIMLGINVLTSLGYYVVAQGILENENSLGLDTQSTFSRFLAIGNAIGPAITGINNTDIIFTKDPQSQNTFDDLIKYSGRNKLSTTHLSELRKHSIFQPKRPQTEMKALPPAPTPALGRAV